MATNTNIQWCHHTHNAWRGCRKVCEECANCYITGTVPFRTTGQTHGSVRVRAGEATLREPIAWNRKAEAAGERHRVFSLSLGDWLDDENVPIEWFAGLLKTISDTPHLDWLLLTKRPQNWRARIEAAEQLMLNGVGGTNDQFKAWDMVTLWMCGKAPENVWIGVSQGADQASALAIPALVHFLSCEPMLRPLDVTHAAKFDWIIFGGESGSNARQPKLSWFRDGLTFCREREIAAFMKQVGGNISDGDLEECARLSGRSMHDKKGGDPLEWPEELRVREFPVNSAVIRTDPQS